MSFEDDTECTCNCHDRDLYLRPEVYPGHSPESCSCVVRRLKSGIIELPPRKRRQTPRQVP